MKIHSTITKSMKESKKLFAVLIDPDDVSKKNVDHLINLTLKTKIDLFFVGGSFISKNNFSDIIQHLKKYADIPVIVFPGSIYQIDSHADAILLLTLISGRNPEYLIGKHVHAAPYLKKSDLEILSTGYMLIDGGNISSVQYISNTMPIPSDKYDIAASTAMAGEMIGNQLIYMDAGSGAKKPVSAHMISHVKHNIQSPLIVGGGIKTAEQLNSTYTAGADIAVIGNAIEKDPSLIVDFSSVALSFRQ